MAYSRYGARRTFINDNKEYRNVFFRERDVTQIVQYGTARLSYPSPAVIRNLTNVALRWKSTDTLYNMAAEYYGSPQYWWVIAWYNKKPTESHFKVGDIYYVPLPLETVLGYF
tara:strand:+ start:810 stop:1148 length:339 start_codon:yes stop_codon:yes gene_type:complete